MCLLGSNVSFGECVKSPTVRVPENSKWQVRCYVFPSGQNNVFYSLYLARMHNFRCFLFLLKYSEVMAETIRTLYLDWITAEDDARKVPETVTSLLCPLKTHDVAANCGKEDACDALHLYLSV
jgi:hypothetical protein